MIVRPSRAIGEGKRGDGVSEGGAANGSANITEQTAKTGDKPARPYHYRTELETCHHHFTARSSCRSCSLVHVNRCHHHSFPSVTLNCRMSTRAPLIPRCNYRRSPRFRQPIPSVIPSQFLRQWVSCQFLGGAGRMVRPAALHPWRGSGRAVAGGRDAPTLPEALAEPKRTTRRSSLQPK